MIEIEPISCAAEPGLCRAIERFGMKTGKCEAISDLDGITEQFWYEGDTFYRVMTNGLVQLDERDHHNAS